MDTKSIHNSPFERRKFIEEIYENFLPGDKVRVIDSGVTPEDKRISGIPTGVCTFKEWGAHTCELNGDVLPGCKGWAHKRSPVCVQDQDGNIWGLGYFCVLEKVEETFEYPPIGQIGILKILNKNFSKKIGLLSSANKMAKVINKPIFDDYVMKPEWTGIDYNNTSNVAFEILDDGGIPLKTPVKVLLRYPTDAVFEPDPNKATTLDFVGHRLGDEVKVKLDHSIYEKYRNFLEKEMESSLGIPSGKLSANPVTIKKPKMKVEIVKIKR